MKLYCVATSDRFIMPILKELLKNTKETGITDCTVDQVFNADNAHDADIIWCEWADHNAITVQEHVTLAKKILRVHRYEAYTEQFKSIMFDEYDTVIFVAEHLRDIAEQNVGHKINNAVVIPNYLNLDDYVIPKGKKINNKIACAGYLCRKKGIGELMMIASELPDYEFHIAGEVQDGDIDHFITTAKPRNVILYPWTEDVKAFYADKTYVINTALNESFSMATAEGILCGCAPLVRSWDGASKIYNGQTFTNITELKNLLASPYNPQEYRDYFIRVNNLNTVIASINGILHQPPSETHMPSLTVAIVQTREKYMPRLMNSLRLQKYPIKVDILRNFDKEMSIGRAFNILADRCDTDWIVYVGDDDWLAEGYIAQVIDAYVMRQKQYPSIVACLTGACLTDGEKLSPITSHPTGFWLAEYVRQTRFNEALVRQVDTDFTHKAMTDKRGITVMKFDWIVGYYYFQHQKNVSGNKFTEGAITHQEKTDG